MRVKLIFSFKEKIVQKNFFKKENEARDKDKLNTPWSFVTDKLMATGQMTSAQKVLLIQ